MCHLCCYAFFRSRSVSATNQKMWKLKETLDYFGNSHCNELSVIYLINFCTFRIIPFSCILPEYRIKFTASMSCSRVIPNFVRILYERKFVALQRQIPLPELRSANKRILDALLKTENNGERLVALMTSVLHSLSSSNRAIYIWFFLAICRRLKTNFISRAQQNFISRARKHTMWSPLNISKFAIVYPLSTLDDICWSKLYLSRGDIL